MKEIQIIVTGNRVESINQFTNSIGDESLQPANKTWTDKRNSVCTSTTIQHNSRQVDDAYRINFFVGKELSHFEYFESIDGFEYKGMVVVFDATNQSDLTEVERSIRKHSEYLIDFALILVVTNLTEANKGVLTGINQLIESNGWLFPVLEVNPTNPVDVSLAIETLLYFKNPIVK